MNKTEVEYWTSFYNKKQLTTEPSLFCKFVMDYFKDLNDIKILDAGCGSGRDSYYLSKKYKVMGVDTSFLPENRENCEFNLSNFIYYAKGGFDVIYSRFTFHSITDDQQEEFIKSIEEKGVYLCIETRSKLDEELKKVHGKGHYRNYKDEEYIRNLLSVNDFKILYLEESDSFSPYKDEKPFCIRVIAVKG